MAEAASHGQRGSQGPEVYLILWHSQCVWLCSEEATINALVSSAAFYKKVRQHSNIAHGNQQQRTSRSFSHQAVTAPRRATTSRAQSAARTSSAQTGPQAAQQPGGIFVGAFKGQANDICHVDLVLFRCKLQECASTHVWCVENYIAQKYDNMRINNEILFPYAHAFMSPLVRQVQSIHCKANM